MVRENDIITAVSVDFVLKFGIIGGLWVNASLGKIRMVGDGFKAFKLGKYLMSIWGSWG